MIYKEKVVNPDPRWGAENRDVKARAILQTISHFVPLDIRNTVWLDIGCGNGEIASTIALQVGSVTGVDPESWSCWNILLENNKNLFFLNEAVEKMSISSESVDFVICNQVYEHVENPIFLINEIYRVLKPGGYCYFAGPNFLFPVEPHVFLPFVHWLPRNFAVKLIYCLGGRDFLEANSLTYWRLRKILSKFKVINAVPYVVKNFDRYGRGGLAWKFLSLIPEFFLEAFTWISPGFVFLCKKET